MSNQFAEPRLAVSLVAAALVIACVLGCRFGGASESENKNAPVKQSNSARKPENAATPRPDDEPSPETNDEPNEPEESNEPIRSTALVEAFKRDETAANSKYKGKIILIRGRITNINDVFGVKALNLRDSENAPGLQTYLKNSADVERVKVGDEVTVRGKVRGDKTDVVDDAVIVEVN